MLRFWKRYNKEKGRHIPVIDCDCGAGLTPMTHRGDYSHPDRPGEENVIRIWTCPLCDRMPFDKKSKVWRGYTSEAELAKDGWERQEASIPKPLDKESLSV